MMDDERARIWWDGRRGAIRVHGMRLPLCSAPCIAGVAAMEYLDVDLAHNVRECRPLHEQRRDLTAQESRAVLRWAAALHLAVRDIVSGRVCIVHAHAR